MMRLFTFLCGLLVLLFAPGAFGHSVTVWGTADATSDIQEATDCMTASGGVTGTVCQELDDNTFYVCESGPCNGSGWSLFSAPGSIITTDPSFNTVTWGDSSANNVWTWATTNTPNPSLSTSGGGAGGTFNFNSGGIIAGDASFDDVTGTTFANVTSSVTTVQSLLANLVLQSVASGDVNITSAGDIDLTATTDVVVVSDDWSVSATGAATFASLDLGTGTIKGGVDTTFDTATNIGTLTADGVEGTWYGVTAAGTITLPAITASGQSACFYAIGAIAITIDPNAADGIRLDGTLGTDGVTIVSPAASGDFVCLLSRDNGTTDEWIVLGKSGTWTVGS